MLYFYRRALQSIGYFVHESMHPTPVACKLKGGVYRVAKMHRMPLVAGLFL